MDKKNKLGGFIMKRTITLILTFCIMLTSISAFSACAKERLYSYNNKTKTLTINIKGKMKYNCENAPWKDVEQPEHIVLKKGVTSISSWGFGCKIGDDSAPLNFNCLIKSVKIPNTVKTIGADAFWHCTSIKKISIPNSVKSIANDAFGECKNLSKVKLSRKLKTIKSFAFSDCPKLKKITIPKSVKKIGKKAFGYKSYSKRIKCFTIKGYKGTAAEKYAKKNKFKFVAID